TNDQAFQTTIRKRGIHADSLADRKIIGQHKLFPIPLRGLLYFAEALAPEDFCHAAGYVL
ncbi:MAG: hypothetical protein V2A66_10510, partial [Pseudomonadota bacterium]